MSLQGITELWCNCFAAYAVRNNVTLTTTNTHIDPNLQQLNKAQIMKLYH